MSVNKILQIIYWKEFCGWSDELFSDCYTIELNWEKYVAVQ